MAYLLLIFDYFYFLNHLIMFFHVFTPKCAKKWSKSRRVPIDPVLPQKNNDYHANPHSPKPWGSLTTVRVGCEALSPTLPERLKRTKGVLEIMRDRQKDSGKDRKITRDHKK